MPQQPKSIHQHGANMSELIPMHSPKDCKCINFYYRKRSDPSEPLEIIAKMNLGANLIICAQHLKAYINEDIPINNAKHELRQHIRKQIFGDIMTAYRTLNEAMDTVRELPSWKTLPITEALRKLAATIDRISIEKF
jgi:hypothetical protein